MADGIYYNAEVTSDDLNDLANDLLLIDDSEEVTHDGETLGYTSFNGFDGVTKFGADKLNEITAHLVSKGILNRDNLCKPVIVDDKVNIQSGIIVFNNGAKKVIKDVVSVDKVNNTYVYALNDTAAGNCKLVVSENDPETDENVRSLDYIPIAFIDENGALTDKRIFAAAYARLPGTNTYYKETITHLFSANIEGEDVIKTIDVNFPFQYAWIKDYSTNDNKLVPLYDNVESERIAVGYYERVSIIRNGTTIKLLGYHSGSGAGYTTFTVYFA